jgi:hypothetical protein
MMRHDDGVCMAGRPLPESVVVCPFVDRCSSTSYVNGFCSECKCLPRVSEHAFWQHQQQEEEDKVRQQLSSSV